jgi:GntR family transcriptional regulator/MocR family aminotransferase
MFTFYFEENSRVSRYEQLYRHVKKLIMDDILTSRSKLPSRRKLADHLRISVTTVDQAYQQLIAEGYVISLPKRGFFVADILKLPVSQIKKCIRETIQHPEKKAYRFDFCTNVIDPDQFPYLRWAKLEKETILNEIKDRINDQDPLGYYPLRAEIAKYLSRYRGIDATPEQILIGTGSETMITVLRGLFGDIATVALENPGVSRMKKMYDAFGIATVPVALDANGLSLNNIRDQKVTILHVTPSHQFPTGIVMPISRRMELLEWSGQLPGRFLVEDDYDSEFRFSGNPIPAMASLDREEKVIYMNSFTKSIAPSLRINFLVLPYSLLSQYLEVFRGHHCPVSLIAQVSLYQFMKQGWFESHLNRMKQRYREKRDVLIQRLKSSPLGDKVHIENEDSGLHFLVRLSTLFSEEDIVEMAMKKGIRVYSISEYSLEPLAKRPATLVIGYSGLNPVMDAAQALFALLVEVCS